ncbi:MAG: PAS domain-containing protein [Collinsella sp.]|nr:PAS domain-containing protein [Collinsella sp.]
MNPTVKSYIPLVDFLEEVLGRNSEIVLHDFSNPDHSVVDIRNGEVSGRKVGAPATDFALRMLREDAYRDKPYLANYVSHSSTNKPLQSASLFIREEGGIVGMVCVNTDNSPIEQLGALASQISSLFSPQTAGDDPAAAHLEAESLTDSTHDLITKSIHDLTVARGMAVEQLGQSDRIDIIRTLNANGMFLLKGAVASAAEALGISEPSVYRYLQKVRKE